MEGLRAVVCEQQEVQLTGTEKLTQAFQLPPGCANSLRAGVVPCNSVQEPKSLLLLSSYLLL